MKKTHKAFLMALICLILVNAMGICAAFADASAAEMILDIPTVQAFTDEAVSEEDINAVVMAGVNAPSAMNGQPWHFSVVTDSATLEEMAGGMSFGAPGGDMPFGDTPFGDIPAGFDAPGGMQQPGNAPAGIPGNMPEGSGAPGEGFATSGAKAGIGDAPLVIVVSCKEGSDLDAGLATQNMSAEAQLLGYGTKIISSPKMTLNSDSWKATLGVPEDMAVVCVLLVGKVSTEDYDVLSGATARNPADDVVTYVK